MTIGEKLKTAFVPEEDKILITVVFMLIVAYYIWNIGCWLCDVSVDWISVFTWPAWFFTKKIDWLFIVVSFVWCYILSGIISFVYLLIKFLYQK